jgi:hypothetical protein
VTNLADGSAPGVDVEVSARLTAQLGRVALGILSDRTSLVEDLSTLVVTLATSVSGYAGLQLTVVHTGHPVRLTTLVPPHPDRSVVTSLRLPLSPVASAFEDGGRLVLWSTVPGALVDLAADLAYVLRDPRDEAVARASPVVELDVDLPMPDAESGVDGLDELATIHRAAGFLIEQGHDPTTVHDTLRAAASANGLTSYAWAERLLRLR